ncbi:hypothetical protein [Zunongwangia sp. H14]|uniref:hypothetical protein n=1 Tax=Zunongwangia sp. H14 TaxID=3240792 RepID=UPI003567B0BB
MTKDYLYGIALFAIISLFNSCVTVNPTMEEGTRTTAEGFASEPGIPLSAVTNETTAQQLSLAKNQGKAVEDAFFYLKNHANGAQMMAGPYKIAYVLERPKGWYTLDNETLHWHEPEGNAFLGVLVRDGYDGRAVPGVKVTARLLSPAGEVLEEYQLPMGYHPLVNRHGTNINLPSGPFSLKILVDPPRIRRHDPVNGDRYHEQVFAQFNPITIGERDLKEAENTENEKEWMPLAQNQGRAIKDALNAMISSTAMDGEEIQIGDYLLTYAVEYAESFWEVKDGKLRFNMRAEQSTEKNAHVEVVVRDVQTGRIIPGFQVTTSFYKNNDLVEKVSPGMMWHPWLYHYGLNIRVPKEGKYQLEVTAPAPEVRRYGREYGNHFAEDINYRFDDVDVEVGQK